MNTRRAYLRATLGLAAGGLAGCVGQGGGGSGDDSDGGTPSDSPTSERSTTQTSGPSPIPTADRSLHTAYEMDELRSGVRSGGPPKDGIPSIDEPKFKPASESDVLDGMPVFGLVRNGDVKAYPQYILVHHEIVNDEIGGDNVAVTYCPLTGTVQGFERGPVEFGVSGKLLNSNLVMYDRHRDSRWPQMLATAISGPMTGETLQEFRVLWTTWGKWRAAHPDTKILTEDTGHARRYGNDPYGDYNPPSGYYENSRTLFAPLTRDDRAGQKDVVMGARTSDGAIAFRKDSLLENEVLTGSIGDTDYVAAAEQTLDTAYVYENPDGLTVEAAGDGEYVVDGDQYGPLELPLDRVLTYDSMWFAWAGYYPETTYVE